MCGCGINKPCFGGCSCGCDHRGPSDVRYLRDSRGFVGGPDPEQHNAGARPVVVIDPEDRAQVKRLGHICNSGGMSGRFTERLQAALREFANPTPPKPVEPTGLGAVVEDTEGERYVRHGSADLDESVVWCNSIGVGRSWARIEAVRVLSEGVTQ